MRALPPPTRIGTAYAGTIKAGLCDSCRHQRIVRNTRGSAFSLCERAKFDDRYRKYPRLPVERCAGWEQVERPGRATS